MSKLTDFGLSPLPEYRDIDVKQVKSGRGHAYKVTGYPKNLTSVTTHLNVIAKPFLVPWARKQTSERWLGEMEKLIENIGIGTTQNVVERMILKLAAVEDGNKPGEDGYNEYLKEVADWASEPPTVGHEEYLNEVYDWAKKDDTEGRDLGTATHNLIENLLAGTSHEVDAETRIKVQPAVDGAMKLIELKGFKIVAVEVPVWHPFHHFAGMIDLLVSDPDGYLGILDWKRAKQYSDEYALQVAAYSDAIRVLLGLPYFPRGYVAKLAQEDGQDSEIKEADIGEAIEGFLKAQRLKEGLGSLKVWV